MLDHHLQSAWRHYRKNPLRVALNLTGLAVSFAASLLIGAYAWQELSYDQFHSQHERIFLAYKERMSPGGNQVTYDTWTPFGGALVETFPSIEMRARVYSNEVWIGKGQREYKEWVTYTDPELFQMFDFGLLHNDGSEPLARKQDVLISQEVAQRYFGEVDPLGQTLTLNFNQTYTITGILKEVPPNSTIQPEILIRLDSDPEYVEYAQDWRGSFLDTYLLLAEGEDASRLEPELSILLEQVWGKEELEKTRLHLMPLAELNNALNGNRVYAWILLGVAISILLLAGFNYVNLATAQTLDRAHEVAIRKVLGGSRKSIIHQILLESLLLSLAAGMIALGIGELTLPIFENYFGVDISYHQILSIPIGLFAFLLACMVGFLAGLYPALHFSAVSPVRVLGWGMGLFSRKNVSRQGLVIAQFMLSIILIAASLVIGRQVQFMMNSHPGFNVENLLVLPVELPDFAEREEALAQIEIFKEKLAGLSGVESVTSSSHIPGNWDGWFTFAFPEGWTEGDRARLRYAFLDAEFFSTYGISFTEGRNFIKASQQDMDEHIIINESARRYFGWRTGQSIGKQVKIGSRSMTVIGVVKDYQFQGMQVEVAPVIHVFRPPGNAIHSHVSLRLEGDLKTVMAGLDPIWQQLAPGRDPQYHFLNELLSLQYQTDQRLARLIRTFSLLALFVAILGIFGLAAYMAERRRKEIGIRRVMGASTGQLVWMLSASFGRWVLLAGLLAIPLAWWMMSNWLESYAHRINLSWTFFAIAGIIALVLAMGTASLQSLRTAHLNPADVLRDE